MAAYKLIKLTRGVVAVVDAKDYERVNKHLWRPAVQAGRVDRVASDGDNATFGDNVTLLLHRFILGLEQEDGQHVDHWNHNVYDNRRCNLRVCSKSENGMNQRKQSGTVSQYKGVALTTGTGPSDITVVLAVGLAGRHAPMSNPMQTSSAVIREKRLFIA